MKHTTTTVLLVLVLFVIVDTKPLDTKTTKKVLSAEEQREDADLLKIEDMEADQAQVTLLERELKPFNRFKVWGKRRRRSEDADLLEMGDIEEDQTEVTLMERKLELSPVGLWSHGRIQGGSIGSQDPPF